MILRHIMKLLIQLALLMLVTVTTAGGYHILCYCPIPTKSHDILAWGVIKPLLQAGHKITWITPFPVGKPGNVTVIDVSQTIAVAKALNMETRKISGFEIAKSFADNITKAAFSKELQKLLQENQYDAVISEWFFSDIEAGFAAVQKVPWIVLNGFPMHRELEGRVDTVKSILSIPALGYSYPLPLSFWDRIKNTLNHILKIFDDWANYHNEAALYESFFKPVAEARGVILPPYSEAIRHIAVVLANGYPPFTPAYSVPPNVVDIGGYHIDEQTPPLPEDLQEILDSSPEGVVYFSMGSMLRAANLPEQTKQDFIEVLSSIPYTVLWKFEEELENLPSNIHVRDWMPQSSILAHPHVKLFISHCGVLSNLEAMYYGVPILALPVFGDQPSNADAAAWSGYAIKIPYRPDLKEDFEHGLKEILSNDRYYKKARYMSKLFRNRPVAPSALIRHYVELAIESKGANHLRSTTRDYAWYQIWMLDQAAVLILTLIVIYLFVIKIINTFKNSSLKEKKIRKNKKSN